MRYIVALALTFAAAASGAGCGFQDAGAQDAGGRSASLVEVAVTFTQRARVAGGATGAAATTATTATTATAATAATADRSVELAAQGHFARFRADELDRTATLLGLPQAGAIPLDGCVLVDVGEELDRAFRGGASTPADVQLLDAGRLLVKGPLDATQLARRRYPELTPEVSGVVYSAADAARLSLEPGAPYAVVGEGGGEVGPFVAQAQAPRAFPVLVGPELRRGSDLVLRWAEAGEATDPLLISIAWSSRAGARELRCRVVDDGQFVVPQALVASLPHAGSAASQGSPGSAASGGSAGSAGSAAEVVVTRRRHARFVATGVGMGDVIIGLRDVAPLLEAP